MRYFIFILLFLSSPLFAATLEFTGTLTPDSTGDFVEDEEYNEKPFYYNVKGWYLWWNITTSRWVVSEVLGSDLQRLWISENKIGIYAPMGEAYGIGNMHIKDPTYYVDIYDSNGLDTNTGLSWAQAWKTLAKAQSVATSGDTVYLRNGNYGSYTETTTVRTDWVTYKADTGHNDVNFTSISLGQWNGPFNKYLIFDGIKVSPGSVVDGALMGIYIIASDHLRFRNMSIYKGGGYSTSQTAAGIWLRSSDDIEVNNVTIWGLPTGTDYGGGFRFGIYCENLCNDVTVTDCNITDCEIGIMPWGTNWNVRRNVIHDTDRLGIFMGGCKNTVIEDNHIYNMIVPIYVRDASGASYDADSNTITAGSGTPYTAVKAGDFVRLTIDGLPTTGWPPWYYIKSHTDNTITLISGLTGAQEKDYEDLDLVEVKEYYHTDGIYSGYPGSIQSNYVRSQNVIIRRNRIHNIDATGFRFSYSGIPNLTYPWLEHACDWVIENNLLYNVGADIMYIGGVEDVNICNNTIIGTVNIQYGAKLNFFANNIMDTVCLWYEDNPPVTEPNYEDYNIARYWPVGWGRHGAHDIDVTDAEFTALFTNAVNSDYSLKPGSAAVNFGNATYAPTTDILGHSRNFPPDAGCYEYVAGDPENTAPELVAIGAKSVDENKKLTIVISATDIDEDPITYAAAGLPIGATFNAETKTFDWTPTYSQSGSVNVLFIASDGDKQDTETVTITVNNRPQGFIGR